MAIRVTPNLLKSFRTQFTRALSSTPSSLPVLPLNFDDKPEPDSEPIVVKQPQTQTQQSSILDFDDTQKLFSSVSTTKLLKSSIVLNSAAIDHVVNLGIWIMRSKLIETPVLREIILGCVKRSFYEQFVAGKDLEETGRTIRKIWDDAGLRSMLNYGLEHAHDNQSCDMNFQAVLETIECTKHLPPSSVRFFYPQKFMIFSFVKFSCIAWRYALKITWVFHASLICSR